MKYNNKKIVVNGISFDSRKEANRYAELKLLERGKRITNLRTQVPFVLLGKQSTEEGNMQPIKYIADFTYKKDGKLVVEDVKGYRNPSDPAYRIFIMKKKLMYERFKILVKEI